MNPTERRTFDKSPKFDASSSLWWTEGYRKDSGWALSEEKSFEDQGLQNRLDAQLIYSMLRNDVIPKFYDRDGQDVPQNWVKMIKHSMGHVMPQFSTRRMLGDYKKKFYSKIARNNKSVRKNDFELARKRALDIGKFAEAWPGLQVETLDLIDTRNYSVDMDTDFTASLTIKTGNLKSNEIDVEMIFGEKHEGSEMMDILNTVDMDKVKENGVGEVTYTCKFTPDRAGLLHYGFRITPRSKSFREKTDFGLVKWV